MIDGKLTQKDITEWCRSHKCTDEDCKYMINGGCYIMDSTILMPKDSLLALLSMVMVMLILELVGVMNSNV